VPRFAVDLHAHSRFFHGWDGRATRFDPIGLRLLGVACRARGLDGFAVTNHDYTYAGDGADPSVVPGIEVSTTMGHVLVVGPDPPERTTVGSLTPAEVVEAARDRGCATILAHPYRDSAARDSGAEFDAVELNGKNPEHAPRTRRLAKRLDVPLVAGSDAHYPFELGRAYTLVEAPTLSPTAVAEAVRDGRVEPVLELGAVDRILDRGYNAVHRMRRINRAVRRE